MAIPCQLTQKPEWFSVHVMSCPVLCICIKLTGSLAVDIHLYYTEPKFGFTKEKTSRGMNSKNWKIIHFGKKWYIVVH